VENDLYLYVRRMSGGGTLTNQNEGHGEGSGSKVWAGGGGYKGFTCRWWVSVAAFLI
jgi:hypothetical protein